MSLIHPLNKVSFSSTLFFQLLILLILSPFKNTHSLIIPFNNQNLQLDPESQPYKYFSSSKNHRHFSFSPETCNRNRRTKIICEILSRSKKFKNGIYHKIPEENVYKTQDQTQAIKRQFNFNQPPVFKVIKSRRKAMKIFPVPTRSVKFSRVKPKQFTNTFNRNHKLLPHSWRNVVSDLPVPVAVAGAPLIWTLATLFLLKSQIKQPNRRVIIAKMRVPIRSVSLIRKLQPQVLPCESKSKESEESLEEKEKQPEKAKDPKANMALAKEILGLTSESLNLASNKLNLFNIVARTLTELGGGGGGGDGDGDGGLLNFKLPKGRIEMENNIEKSKSGLGQNFNNFNVTELVGNFVKIVAEQAIKSSKLKNL